MVKMVELIVESDHKRILLHINQYKGNFIRIESCFLLRHGMPLNEVLRVRRLSFRVGTPSNRWTSLGGSASINQEKAIELIIRVR